VPGEAAALRAENARLREANERLRVLLEDKDAKIAELEEKVARLERLVSRNSGNSSMPPLRHEAPRCIPGLSREELGRRFLGLMAYPASKD